MHISKTDLERYDKLWEQYWDLGSKEKKLFEQYGFSRVKRYDDPRIPELYGKDVAQQMYALYRGWLDLRYNIESFLQEKCLPSEYPERSLSRPYPSGETFQMNYDGSARPCGFDHGPAKWCSIALDGSAIEIHRMLHLQKIEMYTKLGLVVGTLGLIVGLISILT